MNKEIAVFGGGCFWCTEAVFQRLRGVLSVMPGYTGGHVENPTYEQIAMGNTGHVEAIKVEYDPLQIKFDDLLNVFFATHNPITPNRQGYDVGEQYRSVIFYADENQHKISENYIRKLEEEMVFEGPIVTTVEPLGKFYSAEDYHLNYYNKYQGNAYCQVVIDPKLAKLRAKFAPLLKPE